MPKTMLKVMMNIILLTRSNASSWAIGFRIWVLHEPTLSGSRAKRSWGLARKYQITKAWGFIVGDSWHAIAGNGSIFGLNSHYSTLFALSPAKGCEGSRASPNID